MTFNARPDANPAGDDVKTHETIQRLFQDSRSILIVSHIRPDGDAIGSLLGLGLALIQNGKNVRMVLADGVPQTFRFLKGSELIHRSAPVSALDAFDLVITLDLSDLQRTGGVLGERMPDLNIDHHVTNLNFARTNLVLPDRAATAQIIAEFLISWGLTFNTEIASALLTGIVTDTIGYRTSNVTPQSLRLSADLMEMGADLPDLYTRSLITKSYEAIRYWGQGLIKLRREVVTIPSQNGSKTTVRDENRVMVWTDLSLQDRQEVQYIGNDDADLINTLSTIEGDVAIIFVEQKNGHVKVSWRARPGFDVSQIALKFGGGGHPAAAGADIPGSLEAVQPQVLEATRAMLALAANQVT